MSNNGAILITGGAGFVGSSLAIWLKSRYADLRVIAADNLRRRGSELNLARLREYGVEFIHWDIRNAEDMVLDDQQIDFIVECSAEASVLAGYSNKPDYVINTNLIGVINCLELARQHNSRVIFLSSSRVYPTGKLNSIDTLENDSRLVIGPTQSLPGISRRGISEQFTLEGIRSLYGTTKLCAELLIQEYSEMYGIGFITNRCGVIAGPWQLGHAGQGIFTHWMAMHYFRGELSYIGWGGQGKQVRDLLDISDLIALLDLQMSHFATFAGQTYNVGGGVESSLSLQVTTALCQEITGNKIPIHSVPANRPADVKLYITDNTHVNMATGWSPERTPRETLTSIYSWLKTSESSVRHLWSKD